jgi:hypothetical protein
MQNSSWTSTINLWNIATPAAPTSLGQITGQSNVLSIAIDPSNNIYFLAVASGVSTSFFACPAPATGGTYTCGVRGTPGAIPQGAWLAVDAQGNAYATQFSSSSFIGVVRFPTAAGPVTGSASNMTAVYTSAGGNTVTFYGLAVTPDGSTLYVSEGPANVDDGFDLTMHMCSTQCMTGAPTNTTAGGTDITQTLVTNGGSFFALSGAVAIGPGNSLVVGGANGSNGTSAPSTLTVAEVCTQSGSGANLTFACKSGQQTYGLIEGDINPYAETLGIAADSSGNTYAAVLIENNNQTITPTPPTFIGFQPPGSAATLNYLAVTGPQGPAIGAAYYDAPPYAMAITAQ